MGYSNIAISHVVCTREFFVYIILCKVVYGTTIHRASPEGKMIFFKANI